MLTKDQIKLLEDVVNRAIDDIEMDEAFDEEYEAELEEMLHRAEEAKALLETLKPIEMLTWLESHWLRMALELYHSSTLEIQDKLILPCVGEAFETFKKKLEQLVPEEHQDVSD